MQLLSITQSLRDGKKYRATFSDGTRTDFGAAGMSDYTIHKDYARKVRYMKRHLKDLQTGDPRKAGFLSWYILWSFPSFQKSVQVYKKYVLPNVQKGLPIKLDYELYQRNPSHYASIMAENGLPSEIIPARDPAEKYSPV